MTTSTCSDSELLDSFRRAVEAGDLDGADRLLLDLPRDPPASTRQLIARLHLARGRWRGAARLLPALAADEPALRWELHLARNLARLETRRPELYRRIVPGLGDRRYLPFVRGDRLPTLSYRDPGGELVLLDAGGDAESCLESLRASARGSVESGRPLAVCGVGDGHFLGWLARNPHPVFMDQEQPVHVIEPDPGAVVGALMLQEFSGGDSPFELDRFRWHVGPDWRDQIRLALASDPFLPPPEGCVAQSLRQDTVVDVRDGLQTIQQELVEESARRQAELRAHYEGLDPRDLGRLLGQDPPRPPRVLIMTTRFSTVLQYNARDAQEAFGELGWETRLLIEPSPWQRICHRAVEEILVAWRPDLVFQIDHLRYEQGSLFPAKLPFACWIQDHLDNLTRPEAGKSITPRDFVLTIAVSAYTRLHGYPRRQCIPLNKLTRVPARPASWRSDGEDLVFVSNCSEDPRRVVEEIAAHFERSPAQKHALGEFGERLIRAYLEGETFDSPWQVQRFLSDVQEELGVEFRRSDFLEWICNHPGLFFRLNNLLYRQQTLLWAAQIAARRGLRLGLYGEGWESHPRLGSYARGRVAYGPALEELTRRSRLNLQIVPFTCLHHRLLDGLVAGGFFLIRQHPFDTVTSELNSFVSRHLDESITTLEAARIALDARHRPELDDLVRAYRQASSYSDADDPIELIRAFREAELFEGAGGILPRYEDVAFSSPGRLAGLVDLFLSTPELREEIREEQRRSIERRLSYVGGLRRVLSAAGRLLSSETVG